MSLYPMHEKWIELKPDAERGDNAVLHEGKWVVRVCAGALVLPEQARIAPDGIALFCVACCQLVSPEQGQRAQAEQAAAAEGFQRPTSERRASVGMLSAGARREMAKHAKLPISDALRSRPEKAAHREIIALGLADATGEYTSEGARLRLLILRPEVRV